MAHSAFFLLTKRCSEINGTFRKEMVLCEIIRHFYVHTFFFKLLNNLQERQIHGKAIFWDLLNICIVLDEKENENYFTEKKT